MKEERTIKEEDSGRKQIVIDIAFKFLKIAVDSKARNQKRVPQVRSASKKTYGYIQLIQQ